MSAVNLWKAKKLQSHISFAEAGCRWLFVKIAENNALAEHAAMNAKFHPLRINRFSARYSKALHKERLCHHRQISQREERKRRPLPEKASETQTQTTLVLGIVREENARRATATHPSNA